MNAKLTRSATVLLTNDIVAAANYYRDKLGFSYDKIWNDPPDFVILNRDNMSVMLQQSPSPEHVIPNWKICSNIWNIYFWVDGVERLYEDFIERGAKIDYTLSDKPYGCREFGVQDLDGYDIAFGEIIEE